MTIASLNSLKHVILDERHEFKNETFHADVVGYIDSLFRSYRDGRATIEKYWLTSWANYLNTPESNAYARQEILRNVGKVKSEWRHKINTGKTFEVIETIHSYLMQAIFPNRYWFDVEPAMPGYEELARVLRFYLQNKFRDWRLMTEISAYLRQLCVTGTSVLALPWSDKSRIQFQVLDIFDCYFNPLEVEDTDESPFIRRIKQTRADIMEKIQSKYYSNATTFDIANTRPRVFETGGIDEIDYDNNSQQMHSFRGVPTQNPYTMTDRLTLLEFWGDIHLPYVTIKNVVAVVSHGRLLRLVPNPYKCGRPFVVGSYIPVVRQQYGISAIQSSLGMIQQIHNSVNQMLDGVELAVNPWFTMTPDSGLDPNDFEIEPGKVYQVDSHDSLRPGSPPINNFNLSYQQIAFLEQTVDKNSGVGPLVGVGQPRGGERVTATEIQAVQEAGGNRLLGVYTNIQETSMFPLLEKTFSIVQQFTKVDDTVPIPSKDGKSIEWTDVGQRELQANYRVYPKGAEHIIEKTENARRRMDILALIMKLPPEEAQKINITKLIEDILRNVLYEDPTAYFVQPETPAPTPLEEQRPPLSQTTAETIKAQLMADGGRNLFQKATGLTVPEGMNYDSISGTPSPTGPIV